MAKVTWIKGTIDPPQSGEYYVILESKQDIINPVAGTVDYKTGDVMIYTDQKSADRYGVSKKAMQNAINGVTWKCVPYMPDLPETENREENGL